uniref:Uncharacterized protein n=1 Tax=Candidatus Kentrum sp. TUN TaxID=2126343 RepID=A0A450ZW93_9GAMM|nr:MAG: Uncharacterised protein family (UPF0150) [Candidatus Kentron sp. TUN]
MEGSQRGILCLKLDPTYKISPSSERALGDGRDCDNRKMKRTFTLEYWRDDGCYVGKLREVSGVFSQGETLAELEENIEDAYRLMIGEASGIDHPVVPHTKEIALEVA